MTMDVLRPGTASSITSPEECPQILLMGLRTSGKSSICEVVFNNMKPLEALYIESTTHPTSREILNASSLFRFYITEIPGQMSVTEESDLDVIRYLQNTGALIYVIDCQSEYLGALQNLVAIIHQALSVNPLINIEVLIHKVDGLTYEFRYETRRDIMQRIQAELEELGLKNAQITFYLTSIYDRSIHDALSRIVQRLIAETPTLESILNNLCSSSGVEKAFLMDVKTKIYIATDSSPVDPQTYELCSDFIDVTLRIDELYKNREDKRMVERRMRALRRVSEGNSNSSAQEDDQQSLQQQEQQEQPVPLKTMSKMQNGIALYLSQMVKGLALVGFIRTETMEKMAVLDYNAEIVSEALKKMWPHSEE